MSICYLKIYVKFVPYQILVKIKMYLLNIAILLRLLLLFSGFFWEIKPYSTSLNIALLVVFTVIFKQIETTTERGIIAVFNITSRRGPIGCCFLPDTTLHYIFDYVSGFKKKSFIFANMCYATYWISDVNKQYKFDCILIKNVTFRFFPLHNWLISKSYRILFIAAILNFTWLSLTLTYI